MPAKKFVAAFTAPNAAMKVSVAVKAVRANSLGQQRQHGAFLTDHAAHDGADAHEQRELGDVLPQPEPQWPLGGPHGPSSTNSWIRTMTASILDTMIIDDARRSSLDEVTDWTLWADKVITF